MKAKTTLVAAGILGAFSVLIGAFGAHGLEPTLEANGRLDTFETAVDYQFYHTLALFLIGVAMMRSEHSYLRYAALAFVLGIFVFSGSLYALSLTNLTLLGAVAPVGGLAFVVGWVLLALGAARAKKTER